MSRGLLPPGIRTLAVLVLIAIGSSPALGQTEAEAEAEGLSASFRAATRRVLPAVVTVRSVGQPVPIGPMPIFPGMPAEPPGVPRDAGGSGVVIDAAKGLVLTNDHVVQGNPALAVTLADGRERPVTRVRRDPKSDLALLTIDPDGLKQADWGDSEALDTGDWVLAIGQPFGLSGTVTAGIVSGKGRGVGAAWYEDLIQTDAAINPGNSGGPLVNLKGEVVGINTAIKTQGGGYEGVGFAVPATRARRIAADLAEFGTVHRSQLGITIGRVDPRAAETIGQPGAVAITGIMLGSPAESAGLKIGDIIVTVGGKAVAGVGALQSVIEIAPAGEPLTLRLIRDGQPSEVQVRPRAQGDGIVPREPVPLNPLPIAPPVGDAPPADEPPLEEHAPTEFPKLGLRLGEPTPALIERFHLDPAVKGLVVIGVEPDGPADLGGLEIGMVITDAANRKVATPSEFQDALGDLKSGSDPVIRVLKGNKAGFRVIVVSDARKLDPPPDDPARPEPIPETPRSGGA